MEAVLRALSDESRRTMLEALTEGPATAGELAALLPISRPGVSRHLRVLREAGLVEFRQEAQGRVYDLAPSRWLRSMNGWAGTGSSTGPGGRSTPKISPPTSPGLSAATPRRGGTS